MERMVISKLHLPGDGPELTAALDRIAELEAALLKIAFGETDDFAGNPMKWSTTVAYLALGGRFEGGVRIHERADFQKSESQ